MILPLERDAYRHDGCVVEGVEVGYGDLLACTEGQPQPSWCAAGQVAKRDAPDDQSRGRKCSRLAVVRAAFVNAGVDLKIGPKEASYAGLGEAVYWATLFQVMVWPRP